MNEAPLLLFDGVCNFCDASVQFVLRAEADSSIRFATLQSAFGQQMLQKHHINVDSVVWVEGGEVHTKSSAAVRIARHLRWPYRALSALWIVPKPVRDLGYTMFAALRYTLFGKRASCAVPTAATRARFMTEPT